jgi:hypothetical protein
MVKGSIVGAFGAVAMAACGGRTPLDVGYLESTWNGGAPEDAMTGDGASTDSETPSGGSASGPDADHHGCSASGCQTRAPAQSDSSPPATTCVGSGGGGGSEEMPVQWCTNTWTETCGATLYQVSCSCPEGDCVCFGPTTHLVSYPGCPHCPEPAIDGFMPSGGSTTVAEVFVLCGFPPFPGIL